jgi:hypothetical protein
VKIEDFAELFPTGSRVICDPPPMDTDEDWLVVIKDPATSRRVNEFLLESGFTPTLGDNYADLTEFRSWKKGDLNYIVTADQEVARKYRLATQVAKHLNLQKKIDRIVVFHAIIRGKSPRVVIEQYPQFVEV